MIFNGSSIPLNKTLKGNLPNVNAALQEWFQPMSFNVVTKVVVNMEVVEEMTEVSFQGVWQPLSKRDLYYKPEGQRAWSWIDLHSDPTLVLTEDDVVVKDGVQYRVKATWRYDEYGYRNYHLVQDSTGVGPTITPEVTP